jgi:hypothetical protein
MGKVEVVNVEGGAAWLKASSSPPSGARVTAVDPGAGTLTVRVDDGNTHTLGPDELGPDHLAHGYATTVHRSQGVTFDNAHLFADGGGRELGYVAMSRAKESAKLHVVADNIDQAVEDFSWYWSRKPYVPCPSGHHQRSVSLWGQRVI